MICSPCRCGNCKDCPELARQLDLTLPDVIRAASALCYCAHELLVGG